jgi:hypothetical protein
MKVVGLKWEERSRVKEIGRELACRKAKRKVNELECAKGWRSEWKGEWSAEKK